MIKKHLIYGLIPCVLVTVCLTMYYLDLLPLNKTADPPVEPEAFTNSNAEESHVKLKYYPSPEFRIFDFSMDRKGDQILFGSNTKKVTVIDGEGMLKWEETFDDDPLQTKITSCGNYIGIGTSGGNLLLMKKDQEIIWEKYLNKPITHLALSPEGRWLISGSGNDEESNMVTFFNRENNYEWSKKTGKLANLTLSPDERIIIYTEKETDVYNTVALDLKGEKIWTIAQSELKALSFSGELLAVQDQNSDLVVYNNKKEEKWRKALNPNSLQAYFNTKSNKLLIYDKYGKKNDNLYYFNSMGGVLWHKYIEEDALITFSSDGSRIIYCTGTHQEDAYSKIIVLNEKGDVIRDLEVTFQVEKIIAAENTEQVFLAGNDGSVYQVDLSDGQ